MLCQYFSGHVAKLHVAYMWILRKGGVAVHVKFKGQGPKSSKG